MIVFKNNIFDTFQIYLFVTLSGLAIYFLTTGEIKSVFASWIIFVCLETFLFFLLGRQMNFLIIGDKTLTIKNSWLWWKTREYQLDNILDFEFNFVFRDGTALTITTKDYKIKGHLISTFNKLELDEIRDRLRDKGLRFVLKNQL